MDSKPKLIIVEDSKTFCPSCGRKIGVNITKGYLFSHTLPGSVKPCPEWNGSYEFEVISVSPKQFVSMPPIAQSNSSAAKKTEKLDRNSLKEYPDVTMHSVRALPAGIYGGGKNRRH